VLGIVGRGLVSIGVLMFAFVAYQLWGTGIQTAREQTRLRKEFAEMLETTVPWRR
jgi:sortase A